MDTLSTCPTPGPCRRTCIAPTHTNNNTCRKRHQHLRTTSRSKDHPREDKGDDAECDGIIINHRKWRRSPTTEELAYIGNAVWYNGEAGNTIKNRRGKAGNASKMLNNVWNSSQYVTETKLIFLLSSRVSSLLHGSEWRRMTNVTASCCPPPTPRTSEDYRTFSYLSPFSIMNYSPDTTNSAWGPPSCIGDGDWSDTSRDGSMTTSPAWASTEHQRGTASGDVQSTIGVGGESLPSHIEVHLEASLGQTGVALLRCCHTCLDSVQAWLCVLALIKRSVISFTIVFIFFVGVLIYLSFFFIYSMHLCEVALSYVELALKLLLFINFIVNITAVIIIVIIINIIIFIFNANSVFKNITRITMISIIPLRILWYAHTWKQVIFAQIIIKHLSNQSIKFISRSTCTKMNKKCSLQ